VFVPGQVQLSKEQKTVFSAPILSVTMSAADKIDHAAHVSKDSSDFWAIIPSNKPAVGRDNNGITQSEVLHR
jgi:hypothetical protein